MHSSLKVLGKLGERKDKVKPLTAPQGPLRSLTVSFFFFLILKGPFNLFFFKSPTFYERLKVGDC